LEKKDVSCPAHRKLISPARADIYQTLFADWKEAGIVVEE